MIIPKQVFNVAKVAARASTRYAINGVKLERENDTDRCHAIATDGRALIAASWSDKDIAPKLSSCCEESGCCQALCLLDDFEAMIPAAEWLRIDKQLPKGKRNGPLQFAALDESANGRAEFYIRPSIDSPAPDKLIAQTADGNFPKWRDVMPDYRTEPTYDDAGEINVQPDAAQIAVNPYMLGNLLTAIGKLIEHDGARPVVLTIPVDGKRPIMVDGKSADGIKVRGLLMPCVMPKD